MTQKVGHQEGKRGHPNMSWPCLGMRNCTFGEGLPLVQLAHEFLGVKGGTLQGPRVWLPRGARLRRQRHRCQQSCRGVWGVGHSQTRCWGLAGQLHRRTSRPPPPSQNHHPQVQVWQEEDSGQGTVKAWATKPGEQLTSWLQALICSLSPEQFGMGLLGAKRLQSGLESLVRGSQPSGDL